MDSEKWSGNDTGNYKLIKGCFTGNKHLFYRCSTSPRKVKSICVRGLTYVLSSVAQVGKYILVLTISAKN